MSKPNKVYGGIEWTPANIVTVIRPRHASGF